MHRYGLLHSATFIDVFFLSLFKCNKDLVCNGLSKSMFNKNSGNCVYDHEVCSSQNLCQRYSKEAPLKSTITKKKKTFFIFKANLIKDCDKDKKCKFTFEKSTSSCRRLLSKVLMLQILSILYLYIIDSNIESDMITEASLWEVKRQGKKA